MPRERARLTVLIVENRQMIATILSELLNGAGYGTRVASTLDDARDVLVECQRGMLLADLGMVGPEQKRSWRRLQAAAESNDLAVLTFSCSPLPEGPEDAVVLRSPGEFAAVVGMIEAEWRKRRPLLGATMVALGLLKPEELDAALRAQREFRQVGRSYPLGELLVRLGVISPEDLAKALREQDGEEF